MPEVWSGWQRLHNSSWARSSHPSPRAGPHSHICSPQPGLPHDALAVTTSPAPRLCPCLSPHPSVTYLGGGSGKEEFRSRQTLAASLQLSRGSWALSGPAAAPGPVPCSAPEMGLVGAPLSSSGTLRLRALKLFFAAKEGRNCHFLQMKVRVQ